MNWKEEVEADGSRSGHEQRQQRPPASSDGSSSDPGGRPSVGLPHPGRIGYRIPTPHRQGEPLFLLNEWNVTDFSIVAAELIGLKRRAHL